MNYKDIFVEIVIKKRLKEIIWIFEVYLNFVLGRSNHLVFIIYPLLIVSYNFLKINNCV